MKTEIKDKVDDFFNSFPSCPIGWGGSLRSKGKKLTGEGKILEIYILTKVAEQFLAETKKWETEPKNIRSDSKFIFRGSPGMLWSQTASDFSYFQIYNRKTEKIYELHLGIQVNGASRVLHEIDVILIEESIGEYARNNGEFPEFEEDNVVIAIESKNYTKSSLVLSLGREWLGTCVDIFQGNIHKSNNFHGLFVTSSHSEDIEELLRKNGLDYFKNILINKELLNFSHTVEKLLKNIESSP